MIVFMGELVEIDRKLTFKHSRHIDTRIIFFHTSCCRYSLWIKVKMQENKTKVIIRWTGARQSHDSVIPWLSCAQLGKSWGGQQR